MFGCRFEEMPTEAIVDLAAGMKVPAGGIGRANPSDLGRDGIDEGLGVGLCDGAVVADFEERAAQRAIAGARTVFGDESFIKTLEVARKKGTHRTVLQLEDNAHLIRAARAMVGRENREFDITGSAVDGPAQLFSPVVFGERTNFHTLDQLEEALWVVIEISTDNDLFCRGQNLGINEVEMVSVGMRDDNSLNGLLRTDERINLASVSFATRTQINKNLVAIGANDQLRITLTHRNCVDVDDGKSRMNK